MCRVRTESLTGVTETMAGLAKGQFWSAAGNIQNDLRALGYSSAKFHSIRLLRFFDIFSLLPTKSLIAQKWKQPLTN